MGIIGSLINKAVDGAKDTLISAGKTVAGAALASAQSRMALKSYQSISEQLLEEEPDYHHLLVRKVIDDWRDLYAVFDVHEQTKYYVRGGFWAGNRNLYLYDLNKKELGAVKKKRLAIKNPVTQSGESVFIFEINGKRVGTMKSLFSIKKRKYKLKFTQWHVEGNFMGTRYAVLDKDDRVIMNISDRGFGWQYNVISYPDEKNELIGLLIVLALNTDETN